MFLRHFRQPAKPVLALAIAAAVASLAGCKATEELEYNEKPAFVGAVTTTTYDGVADDLLTAGLGKTGLQSATAPTIVDANAPTKAELRKLAIYNNYRALVDTTAGGGFGTLFGPNVDISGAAGAGEGLIGGLEFMAYADDGTGKQNVTMLLQVPNFFNRSSPCLITATSSGSRGIYGAIGTAGEWGLKRGCAVVYVDKGTGMGVHDLAANTVNLIDGTRKEAGVAAGASNFTAALSSTELTAYNAAFPNRIAVKHAHSQQNPEKDWGLHTLQAVEFAIYILNDQFAEVKNERRVRAYRPENVLVIASSVSNGAGAALAAAEQDTKGLIDGIAVAEPNIQMVANANIVVKRGNVTTTGTGRQLYDYFTLANMLQPCAALSSNAAGSPGAGFVNTAVGTSRCASLKSKGILSATTAAAQADEALAQLVAYGWQPESSLLHASHYALATTSIAVTYANSYGRFSVKDNLCGFSFAVTGADLKPTSAAGVVPRIFATGNGVPPMAGINIVNNLQPGGAVAEGAASQSPSTGVADYNLDGASCLRSLYTGSDANAQKVQQGMAEVRRTGNLRGKPAIIVHGRSDALIPVSFTSRPYFGLNKSVEGSASKLSYIEVTNAQHFDAFNGNPLLAGYDTQFVPLHRYFNQAMDLMYNHLRGAGTLPTSQVVRTIPRGGSAGAAPTITANNVPAISATPAAGDVISFSNNTVTVPD